MKQVLVSIIIPVYNVARFLTEALDSVTNQSYKNLEIIIIDDGSTDGSGEICDSFASNDKRIRIIHQENKGLSHARNVGLDMIHGEVIAFLDSDDAYHYDFITEMIKAMETKKADIVMCKYVPVSTDSILYHEMMARHYPLIAPGYYDREDALKALVERKINISIWNKIYRSYLWDGIRFPDGHVYEDVYVTLSVFNRCRHMLILNNSLYYHRIRQGSITSTYSIENVYDMLLSSLRFISFIEAHTPELFSYEQLNRHKFLCYKHMISFYLTYSKKYNEKWDGVIKEIREQIIMKREYFSLLNNRTKLAYYLIRYIPWLIRGLYPIFLSIRTKIKKNDQRNSNQYVHLETEKGIWRK